MGIAHEVGESNLCRDGYSDALFPNDFEEDFGKLTKMVNYRSSFANGCNNCSHYSLVAQVVTSNLRRARRFSADKITSPFFVT